MLRGYNYVSRLSIQLDTIYSDNKYNHYINLLYIRKCLIMYTLIFKDNDRKEYKVTAANIFTVWYAMGKYISMKYQIRITREILNLRK